MVRLGLALALLAEPAAAGCFGPPMPKLVHFEGVNTVQTLSHTAQDLTYRSILPDGAPVVTTLRSGLFLMASSSHGVTYAYNWVTPLPDLSALTPGFHQTFKADMTVEHASRSFFQTEVEVLRQEVMPVGGCDYPVLVVHRSDGLDGKPLGDITIWLSPSLHFALRVEAEVAGKRQIHQAVGLE